MTTKYHDYGKLRARVEAYEARVFQRAQKASRLAGLGDIGCQLHNCLVSLHYGKPWREVDYHYARKAKWLLNKRQWLARRLLDQLHNRGRVAVAGHVFVPGKGPVAVETY